MCHIKLFLSCSNNTNRAKPWDSWHSTEGGAAVNPRNGQYCHYCCCFYFLTLLLFTATATTAVTDTASFYCHCYYCSYWHYCCCFYFLTLLLFTAIATTAVTDTTHEFWILALRQVRVYTTFTTGSIVTTPTGSDFFWYIPVANLNWDFSWQSLLTFR